MLSPGERVGGNPRWPDGLRRFPDFQALSVPAVLSVIRHVIARRVHVETATLPVAAGTRVLAVPVIAGSQATKRGSRRTLRARDCFVASLLAMTVEFGNDGGTGRWQSNSARTADRLIVRLSYVHPIARHATRCSNASPAAS